MFDQRRAQRKEHSSPITFVLNGVESPALLVNVSGTGALFRFSREFPIGPEAVGAEVTFTSWFDVGALLRPKCTAIRFFEDPEGKLLAVRYLSE
jgi:hypothetical protein